jgi:hypothetical protein
MNYIAITEELSKSGNKQTQKHNKLIQKRYGRV